MRSLVPSVVLALGLLARADDHDHDHDHDHEKPPHGGYLIEVGDHVAHIEVVHDAKAGKVTLYILDGEAKDPVKIQNAPRINMMTDDGAKQVATKAVEPDKEEKASQFEATDDALKADPLTGKISIVIGDKKYNVEIKKEEEHDHEDQDHDH